MEIRCIKRELLTVCLISDWSDFIWSLSQKKGRVNSRLLLVSKANLLMYQGIDIWL